MKSPRGSRRRRLLGHGRKPFRCHVRRFGAEELESRRLLAVTLSYGGTSTPLGLTGDGLPDQIAISQTASTLAIDLGSETFTSASSTGVPGLVYSVSGQPNQSSRAEIDLSGAGAIAEILASLGGGNDSITLELDSSNVGGVTIDGEDGTDQATINGSRVGGGVSVAGANVELAGNVVTADQQRYEDDVVLSQDAALEATVVTFLDDVDGVAGSESLTITGDFVFGDAPADYIGRTVSLESLTVTGSTIFNAGGPVSPWQNPVNNLDVRGDGMADTFDALVILADLNENGPRLLPTPTADNRPPFFFDVDGDFSITQDDAQEVMDALDSGATGDSRPATVRTTEAQTYTGSVRLGQDTRLAGSEVRFLDDVDGTSGMESLDIVGELAFGDSPGDYIGASVPLESLVITGTARLASTLLTAPTITTTGLQRFEGPLILQRNTMLVADAVILDSGSDAATAGSESLIVAGDLETGGPIGSDAALRSLSVSGATILELFVGSVVTTRNQTYSGRVTLAADVTLKAEDVAIGPVELATGNLALDVSGTTSEIAGVVEGSGGITKEGDGSLVLSGANSYTGPTSVSSGSLFIDGMTAGDSAITVAPAARLGGIGQAEGSVEVDGLLGAGDSPGILTTGDLTLDAGSTLEVEVGGTSPGNTNASYDQIDVVGTVRIEPGAILDLVSFDGFAPAGGQSYLIIDNDGSDAVEGTFSGLAEGAVIAGFLGAGTDATITYAGGSGNDVVVALGFSSPTYQVSLDGDDLSIMGADGDGMLTLGTDGSSLIIQDATNSLNTDIPGATGAGTNRVTVPLSTFSGEIVVDANGGNDTLALDASITPELAAKLSYRAGPGDDRLRVEGEGVELQVSNLDSVETIDMTGSGRNILDVDIPASPKVLSDSDDIVTFGGGWTLTGTDIIDGTFYRLMDQGTDTLLLNGPRNWRHPLNPNDVNNSGTFVDAVGDILRLINELNDPRFIVDASGLLPVEPTSPITAFYDVNGDGFLTPVGDVLRQINLANQQAGGEGESVGAIVDSTFFDLRPRRGPVGGGHARHEPFSRVTQATDLFPAASRSDREEDLRRTSPAQPAPRHDWDRPFPWDEELAALVDELAVDSLLGS